MIRYFLRVAFVLLAALLTGCAANQLPGYQNTYRSYAVPDSQMDRIMREFRQYGLLNARIGRDEVGRVRLAGGYRNEEEVDRAFIIVQSVVGIKSTSPFYPEKIDVKRWEVEAEQAMANYSKLKNTRNVTGAPRKRALIIGINTFKYPVWRPIPGEDDALVVGAAARKAGYEVTSLLGADATKARITDALEKMTAEIGSDDSLFLYVSSHGSTPLPTYQGGDNRKMSIVAYDSGAPVIRNMTESLVNLQQTGVPDTLVQRLAQQPTRNTRVIIDTCYSGDMLQGVPDDNRAFILERNGGKPEAAGIAMASWSGKEYTSKGIRWQNDEARSIERGPARDWSDRSHAYTIFTATGENQESLAPDPRVRSFDSPVAPHAKLVGSYFTQSFFAYLEQHDGQMEAAFEDASKFTRATAIRVSGQDNKRQEPRMFSTIPVEQNNLYK